MGLDVGSTTIKAVILDPDENILFEDYRRHHADITGAMASLLGDAADALPGAKVRTTVTGSAGLGTDRKSTRLNSSHIQKSRMPSSA